MCNNARQSDDNGKLVYGWEFLCLMVQRHWSLTVKSLTQVRNNQYWCLFYCQASPRDKTVNLELILRIPDSAERSCPGSVSSRKCLLHEYALNISYEYLTMITWWLDPPVRFHNSSVALAFCFPNSGEMIILQGMVNLQFQSQCVQMCA